jgi:hypothetical protein
MSALPSIVPYSRDHAVGTQGTVLGGSDNTTAMGSSNSTITGGAGTTLQDVMNARAAGVHGDPAGALFNYTWFVSPLIRAPR